MRVFALLAVLALLALTATTAAWAQHPRTVKGNPYAGASNGYRAA